MGLYRFSKSCYDSDVSAPTPNGNPNPDHYEILDSKRVGTYLIIKIKYPDCQNYEGVKILVYENQTLEQLRAQRVIDPHFSQSTNFVSPIARFVPTESGWKMAERLCEELFYGERFQ